MMKAFGRLATLLGGTVLAATSFAGSGAQAQTMEERARTAATAAQAKTGTSDALRENYVTPGISGLAISTIDSSATFTPSLSCQKTASLLQVLIQLGATGDITTLANPEIVEQIRHQVQSAKVERGDVPRQLSEAEAEELKSFGNE